METEVPNGRCIVISTEWKEYVLPNRKPITVGNGKKSSIISIPIRQLGPGYLSTKHGANSKLLKLLNGPRRMILPA
ncbi:hypothetical protein SDC9_202735 [bioreactor metagenome]|uniref:Uncharacterized protein n=1 Tax=bioreactor metagenome TaxID=1076179 RepID=A0A645IV53_9ZZZZ